MVFDLLTVEKNLYNLMMSKDRDSGDSASGRAMRMRNQSPSTHRRSRDRDRASDRRNKERDADSTTMLIGGSSSGIGGGGVVPDTTAADQSDYLDESRLSADELHYHPFGGNASTVINANSDDADGCGVGGAGGNTSMVGSVAADSSATAAGDSSHRPGHHRTDSMQALDRLNTKMACTKESIRKEQKARDDNVDEYLKLAAHADRQQLTRIKAVFEKKNQKSAHSISQLQKKLESYSKRAREVQTLQSQRQGHRQPREVLRDVGQGLKNVGGNIRDGITGLGGSVMSKPREFAHLIKNKFGSADNINQLSSNPELNTLNLSSNQMEPSGHSQTHHSHHPSTGGHHHSHHHSHHGSSTPNHTMVAHSGGGVGGAGSGKFSNDNDSECSSVTSDSIPAGSGKSNTEIHQYSGVLKSILTDLHERREDCEKLREKVDRLESVHKDFQEVSNALETERYRFERLEEQINDLTELHQNEIENLKQAMADMEEKVQYQSDERLRDVNEVLENCQTRISKMEHMSQQQYVTVEGIDNSNARALVVKLINVVLTVLQVVLLLVATAAGIIMPFLKTRVRVLTTLFFVFVGIFVIRQWPDVRDIGLHMIRHLKDSILAK